MESFGCKGAAVAPGAARAGRWLRGREL